MDQSYWVKTEDWHTAGEPFRIVEKLPSQCTTEGTTVATRRKNIVDTPDHPLDLLRRSLCHEPRGHADMYGGFLTPPDDEHAHFGVLFWHKDGFSTACGHGTIALGYWALANGIVEAPFDGSVDVVIDVPSGRVTARMIIAGGVVTCADFINVPSYQFATKLPIAIENEVQIEVDLSFSGAVYASVDVATLKIETSVAPNYYERFIALGRKIKAALGTAANHGEYDLYGICFFETLIQNEEAITQRNVVVFADGQIDRSPCGSGTCARLAVLLAQGKVSETKKLVHRSIIDSCFDAFVVSAATSPTEFPACIPRVRGSANLTGRHSFFIDVVDPTYPGFLLR